MSDETAKNQIRALEREKSGYERRLIRAETKGDTEQVDRLKARIKAVEDSIRRLGPKKTPAKQTIAKKSAGK
jgi:hypothetical protein